MSGIGPAIDSAMDADADVAVAGAPAAAAPVTATQKPAQTAPVDTRVETRADARADAPAAAAPAATGYPPSDTVTGAAQAAPQDAATASAVTETTASPIASMPVAAAKTATTMQVPARPVVGQGPNTAGSIGGMVFALLLVVALILTLGWMARRMPGFARGAGANGLRMVASLPIGARERVVVVEVGQTQLLLGVGPGGTRTLHTLTEPLPEAGPAATPQFAQLLAQHFGKKA